MFESVICFRSLTRRISTDLWRPRAWRTYAVVIILCLFNLNLAVAAEKSFIVTTEEWPPFVSSELPNNGWAMEVAKAALEPQGYEVTLDLLPWARAVRCAKSGECDGLYLSYYVEERTEWAAFSDPIGELRTGLFKLRSSDIAFETLDDLRSYTIGITRGAAVSEEFDSADYLRKAPVEHDSVNIKKLLRGRVAMVVAAEPVLKHLIRTTLPEEEHERFEFMSPHLSVQTLHMAISKSSSDYERKLRDFNEGLARIKADGTYDAIRSAHGY